MTRIQAGQFICSARDISWVVVIAGLIVTVCTALVIIGGIKRIANVSQVVVPFMAVLYVVFAVLLLLCNVTKNS